MIRLYELNAELEAQLMLLESMEDEQELLLDDEWVSYIQALKMERKGLIANLGRAFKCYRAESEAIKEEARFLAARAQAVTHRMERVRGLLRMTLSDGEKYKDTALSIYWIAKPDKVVVDEDLDKVPVEYLRREPKLDDIKRVLKTGEDLDWASLQEQQEKSMVIR